MSDEMPVFSGTHHVRLPVTDVERSFAWYADLLGYERDFPFKDGDTILGWAMKHPLGGPSLVLMHDPVRAAACSGFPFFSFSVRDEATIRTIEKRLDDRGISHRGVQKALVGLKLPFVQDPDGHFLGFYMERKADE